MNKQVEAAFKQLQDALSTAKERMDKETQRLEDTIAATAVSPIIKFERVKMPGFKRVEAYDDTWNSYRGTNWKRAVEEATKALEAEKIRVEEQHAANVAALEHNAIVYAQVVKLMTHIGIPQTVTTYSYPTSRSKTMKPTTKSAGYLSDLAEHCPRSDGYEEAKRRIDEFERLINEYRQARIREDAAKEAEREAKERANKELREQLTRLERLAEKYDVVTVDDAELVLQAVLSKDKYLALSHAMQRVRHDWNDGPGPVFSALGSFSAVTADDQAIFEELSGLCEDWQNDGRVFRDCQFNYTFLRNKAPDELLSDYDELLSLSKLYSMT